MGNGKIKHARHRYLRLLIALVVGGRAIAEAPEKSGSIAAVENGLLVFASGSVQPGAQNIQARMAALHVPGVSVAVIDHGAVAWAKGYGVVDAGRKTPVTNATRFQAASISKTIAAASALSPVVEGKIDLDAPVNAALRGWALPASEIAPGYTPSLRALLSHSAGLNVHGFPGYAVGKPLPTLTQVLDGAPPANTAAVRIDHKPGIWSYSGGGYTIAQKLIGDVSGRPFIQVAEERILRPVGMTLSTTPSHPRRTSASPPLTRPWASRSPAAGTSTPSRPPPPSGRRPAIWRSGLLPYRGPPGATEQVASTRTWPACCLSVSEAWTPAWAAWASASG